MDPLLVAAIAAALTGVSTGVADAGTRQISAALAGLVSRKRGTTVTEPDLLWTEPRDLAQELAGASDDDPDLARAVEAWKDRAASIVPPGDSRNSVSGIVHGPVTQIGDGAQISTIRIG